MVLTNTCNCCTYHTHTHTHTHTHLPTAGSGDNYIHVFWQFLGTYESHNRLECKLSIKAASQSPALYFFTALVFGAQYYHNFLKGAKLSLYRGRVALTCTKISVCNEHHISLLISHSHTWALAHRKWSASTLSWPFNVKSSIEFAILSQMKLLDEPSANKGCWNARLW